MHAISTDIIDIFVCVRGSIEKQRSTLSASRMLTDGLHVLDECFPEQK